MVNGFGRFVFGFGELFEFVEDLAEFFFLFGRDLFHFLEKVFHNSFGSEKADAVGFGVICARQFALPDLLFIALQFFQ